jgi:hypothetical protein
MNKRWLIAGGAVVVIGAAAIYLLPGDNVEAKPAPAQRSARVNVDRSRPAVETPDAVVPQKKKYIKPVEVWDPTNKSFHRPVADADPEEENARRKQDEIVYKTRRLRLQASDAAAQCYHGEDAPDSITISYSITVDKEVVRASNVAIVENGLKDPGLVSCIVQSVRDLSSDGEGLPNMKQDYQLTMSLHDLYTRNRQMQGDDNSRQHPIPEEPHSPVDLPPAQVRPLSTP